MLYISVHVVLQRLNNDFSHGRNLHKIFTRQKMHLRLWDSIRHEIYK